MRKRALVSIVDDNETVRESLPDLLQRFGFDAVFQRVAAIRPQRRPVDRSPPRKDPQLRSQQA